VTKNLVIEFFRYCSKCFGQQINFVSVIGLIVIFDKSIKKRFRQVPKVLVYSKNLLGKLKNIQSPVVVTKNGQPKNFNRDWDNQKLTIQFNV
jgi:hemolysin-activating ACP:hemolysin acyltransferase